MNVWIRSGFKLVLAAALALGCVLPAPFNSQAVIIPPPQKGGRLQLTSTAFKDREPIPAVYTCDGKNISPPLNWTGAPGKTKSFVLIADDPDAPGGGFVHWIVYNLPANATSLEENTKVQSLPGNAKHTTNDFKLPGYAGPCPEAGRPHRYFFRLFALDTTLDLKPDALRKDVEAAMAKHILAQTQLMGIYRRK